MVEPHSPPLVDPADIFAHLFFAAGTRDEVILTGPGPACVGQLSNPADGVLAFKGLVAPGALPPHTPVCVEHLHGPERYHFYTEVIATGDGGVALRVPPAIELAEQRASARVPVPRHACIRFRITGAPHLWPVWNLSMGGLAFVATATDGFLVGQTLEGALLIPGEPETPMTVEVRHQERRGSELGVGVSIVSTPLEGRGRIARLLVRFGAA